MVWRVIGVALALLGVCAVPSRSTSDDAAAPAARTGMEAHIDPQTGRLVPEPVVPPTPRPPIARLPMADVPAPGGGMMVHLNGQFMSRSVASVDADGRVHVHCVTDDGSHDHAGH